MTDYCECCGQRVDDADALLAADIARVEQWAREAGVTLVMGDRLRVKDVATFLGRSPGTVNNWLSAGKLAKVSLRGRSYVPVKALAALLLEQRLKN